MGQEPGALSAMVGGGAVAQGRDETGTENAGEEGDMVATA
jgi:hypothetical protein